MRSHRKPMRCVIGNWPLQLGVERCGGSVSSVCRHILIIVSVKIYINVTKLIASHRHCC